MLKLSEKKSSKISTFFYFEKNLNLNLVIIKLIQKIIMVNIRIKFHRVEELLISQLLMNMEMLLPLLQPLIHSLEFFFIRNN